MLFIYILTAYRGLPDVEHNPMCETEVIGRHRTIWSRFLSLREMQNNFNHIIKVLLRGARC